MDLERIQDQMGDAEAPLPPEQAATVAKYMSALALTSKRLQRDDEPEDLQALLEQCAKIPEVADMVKRMQERS